MYDSPQPPDRCTKVGLTILSPAACGASNSTTVPSYYLSEAAAFASQTVCQVIASTTTYTTIYATATSSS